MMGVFLKRAFVLSLVVHLLFLIVCRYALRGRISSSADHRVTWIQIDSISQKKINQLKEKSHQRVVLTESGKKVSEPSRDSFLGNQNQVVERQTVSRRSQQGSSNETFQKSSIQQSSQRRQLPSLRVLGVGTLPSRRFEDESKGYAPEWATPGTRPQDSILGLPESDRTALNTQEFIFYGYFQRIRSQLDRAWNPILREKLIVFYKQGRTLASDQDHLTQLLVVLNELGEISRVQIVLESGVMDLDDAAISAFKKAGPFPHPPRGMSDLNHEIKISWDFILKT